MGQGYKMVCPKCGYEFNASFGVGMMFPAVYDETIQEGKRGELGEELQKFLLEHPDGAINASYVVSMCKKCGWLENIMDLSMYLPKNGFKPNKAKVRWSVAYPGTGIEYVAPWDLSNKEHYELFAKYPHKCKRCGGDVEIFKEKERNYFRCPHCKIRLQDTGAILCWD